MVKMWERIDSGSAPPGFAPVAASAANQQPAPPQLQPQVMHQAQYMQAPLQPSPLAHRPFAMDGGLPSLLGAPVHLSLPPLLPNYNPAASRPAEQPGGGLFGMPPALPSSPWGVGQASPEAPGPSLKAWMPPPSGLPPPPPQPLAHPPPPLFGGDLMRHHAAGQPPPVPAMWGGVPSLSAWGSSPAWGGYRSQLGAGRRGARTIAEWLISH